MKNYLSLIKFSHTIFALPFALVGYVLGVIETGELSYRLLILVLLCMVFARSAAMAFNRYIDRDIDAQNERTVIREIPSGIIKPRNALVFVLINSGLLMITTYFINPICFFLSPVALLITLGYSFTKRFTSFCHFVLGLGLSLAPVGAYLAVVGEFALIPVIYGFVVLFWVAGFDIIYALLDKEFDQKLGLNSIPVSLGKSGALRLSVFLHLLCAGLLMYAGYLNYTIHPELGFIHLGGSLMFLLLLFYQHSLVSANDLSRVNLAFFTTNGVASILFGCLFIIDYIF